MEFTATKKFNLYPIGDIAFVFDSKSRRKGKRIRVSDVSIFSETQMSIDTVTAKALDKAMREKGSDLLTDGNRFYTIFGGRIGEIDHEQFYKELVLHRELYEK
jgi:hypothetical protein